MRLSALICLLCFWLGAVHAEPNLENSYRVIYPKTERSEGRIEVIEFFSYYCAPCSELHPLLLEWLKNKPKNVSFRRVPIVRRDEMLPAAKLYYSLETLRALDRLHADVYRAVQANEIDFKNDKAVAAWAEAQGLDGYTFLDIYKSPLIYNKAIVAKKLATEYEVRSAPSLAVDGQAITSAELVGSIPGLIPVLNKLIEQVNKNLPLSPNSPSQRSRSFTNF